MNCKPNNNMITKLNGRATNVLDVLKNAVNFASSNHEINIIKNQKARLALNSDLMHAINHLKNMNTFRIKLSK